jgi:hypothetical protein
MPIEDIDYLIQNSVDESLILLIDSSKRNKLVYPNPSHFGIIFDEPISFVHGIQILDTTIPRTMFMIEKHNNLLCFKHGYDLMSIQNIELQIQFKVQDFSSADSFINNINEQLIHLFADENITIDNNDNIYDSSYKRNNSDYPVLRFTSSQPFIINISKSTCATIFGFKKKSSDIYNVDINNTSLSNILKSSENNVNMKNNYDIPYITISNNLTSIHTIRYTNEIEYMELVYLDIYILDETYILSYDDSICINIYINDECIVYQHNVFINSYSNDKMLFKFDLIKFKSNLNDIIDIDIDYVTLCNKYPLIDITSVIFECQTTEQLVTIILPPIKQLLYTKYTHVPIYDMKSYLSSIQFNSEFKLTSDIVINCVDSLGNRILNIHIEIIPHQTNFSKYISDCSKDILKKGNEYTFFITSFDFITNIDIGYSYMINIDNISKNNVEYIYVSTPLLDETVYPQDEIVSNYFELANNYFLASTNTPMLYIVQNDYFEFNFKKNYLLNSVDVNLLSYEGSITKIRIPISSKEPEINDQFIMIFKNSERITLYEVHLHLTVTEEGSFLEYSCDNIATNVLNLIYVKKDMICFLYSKNAISLYYIIDNLVNEINYTFTFTKYVEFGIKSPGMLNLTSENYLIIRCEEIENHVRGSFQMKDVSPGICVINMDVQGFSVGRMDFFSVIYKKFHPIGRLTKLEFTFERKTDGKEYDFKDIDLHFILSVNFYRPKQQIQFQKSILNPEYDPNFLGYFNRNMDHGSDSSESDFE